MKNKKNKYRRLLLFLSGFLAAAVILCIIGYSFFSYSQKMNNKIFEAGAESLEETYGEVAQTFYVISRARWNSLKQIGAYLERFDDDESDEAAQYILDLKDTYGFTDFYLLADNGNYRNVEGEEGFIDLGRDLFTLVNGGQEIMKDGSLPRRENMMFYAVPVEENTFNGFTYCAVAFGYDKQAMANILSVSAYQGAGNAYIAYANGRIAMSMGDDTLQIKNILSAMEDNNVPENIFSQVEKDLAENATNTFEVTMNGRVYYLSYQSLGFQEWMLVSLTPADAANLSMDDIRTSTSRLMMIGMGAIFIVLIAGLLFWFWNSVSRKNRLIAERELIFDMMAQNLDDIYMLFRRDEHEPLYVSPNIKRLLGIAQQEFYSDPKVMQQVCPDESSWMDGDMMNKLAPGETFESESQLVNRKTGEMVLYNFQMYRPNDKKRDVAIGILSNRSKEQAIRRQIEDALAAANSANEAKTVFFSNMSHDIRTPMNAIVGFSSLLEKYADDPEIVREYGKKITASSNYLLQLINDVLDMSKIESGKAELTLEDADMEEILREVESIMRPQMNAKQQIFNINRDLEFKGTVKMDRTRVTQVLLNILSNAMKYTQQGGVIQFHIDSYTVSSGNLAKYRFIIQDNGIGMSKDFQKDVFSAFSREESSVTNKVQGTGLGMSITKTLVEMMGGTIQVESYPGEGSVFSVFLGFRVVDTHKYTAAPAEKTEYSLKGLHILAAEDNELNSELLTELLHAEGAECEICADGKETVEKFTASEPGQYDLILMDIQMPVMNGYDATKAIRASAHSEAKTIPIIAMTANAFAEDVQNALNAGMNAHVAKPIDMHALKEKLAEVYLGGG